MSCQRIFLKNIRWQLNRSFNLWRNMPENFVPNQQHFKRRKTMKRGFSSMIATVVFALAASTLFAGNITGKVKARGARHAGGTVIYIAKIEGKTFEAPKEPVLMDQKDMDVLPHVLPILVGTTVEFQNSDDVLHNVFTPDKCAGKFNLGSWAKGNKKPYTFDQPCIAVILCNVHPEMSAYVVAVETPYFAVTEKDGVYTIEDVPPGKYTLKVWHEKLKGKDVEITVPETGDVTQDFLIRR
jgi:plastocyanin